MLSSFYRWRHRLREGPCLQGHIAQSVSSHSYSSPKGLLFLHLKLSKGWYSSTQVIKAVWERQWWRSWETARRHWEAHGWRMCEQQVAAVSLELWLLPKSVESKVNVHHGRHGTNACSMLFALFRPSSTSCWTKCTVWHLVGCFPFSAVYRWGTSGEDWGTWPRSHLQWKGSI